MAYVAPNWKDGAAPAVDAAALQAISDAIAANEGNITSLQTVVQGMGNIVIGSYVGAGGYGSSRPSSLTFPKPVNFLWIYNTLYGDGKIGSNLYRGVCTIPAMSLWNDSYRQLRGFDLINNTLDSYAFARRTNGGKTIEWYNSHSDSSQGSIGGYTYYYLAVLQ